MMDYKKIGEAALVAAGNVPMSQHKDMGTYYDARKEAAGRAAVAAMIPPLSEDGECPGACVGEDECPFMEGVTCDCTLGLQLPGSAIKPGPLCPANKGAKNGDH